MWWVESLTWTVSYRAWLLRLMAFSYPAQRRSSLSNNCQRESEFASEEKQEAGGVHKKLKVTFDPVQPSRAKANWLMGEITRSTLTALQGFGFTSQAACDSGCSCICSLLSLKMDKHLSKRSILEAGRAGPSLASR